MKISIIVPVYNTEPYVEQCLLSCLSQDLSKNEYEIVVVNDGTLDNSMSIVNRIRDNNNNVFIISQENKGLSAARNTGMAHARGKYVWFVDSDDWIKKDCLKGIVHHLEKENLDGLVHAGIRYIDENNIYRMEEKFPDEILTGRQYMALQTMNCAAQKTIYRREFLQDNNLLFFEGIYHEDVEFSPRAYYLIERLGFTHERFYYNRLTPGSITQKPNPKKAFDLMTVARHLFDFKKMHDMQGVEKAFDYLIASTINQALYNTTYMDKETKDKLGKVILKEKNLLQCYRGNSSFKYKIEGLVFGLFPAKVIELYSMLSSTTVLLKRTNRSLK